MAAVSALMAAVSGALFSVVSAMVQPICGVLPMEQPTSAVVSAMTESGRRVAAVVVLDVAVKCVMAAVKGSFDGNQVGSVGDDIRLGANQGSGEGNRAVVAISHRSLWRTSSARCASPSSRWRTSSLRYDQPSTETEQPSPRSH
jgi:hypothetical protein